MEHESDLKHQSDTLATNKKSQMDIKFMIERISVVRDV